MAAILLVTTTPGSEGTLGGLVAQGRRVDVHLERALSLARLCSNDPVCAGHAPNDEHGDHHLEGAAATLVVESVLAERTVRPRPELELVWTGREGGATLSRDTSQVLPQLFARAGRRVIVAGFAFYEASNIFEPLHARARDAGVEVEFFIHVDGTGHNARMSPSNFFTYSWPWHDVTPRLYYDARADTADASSTMHAKCVIVDDREVLITTANFTGRAQHDNVELGVLIRDTDFAARVSGQWHTLVTRGLFRCHDQDAGAAP